MSKDTPDIQKTNVATNWPSRRLNGSAADRRLCRSVFLFAVLLLPLLPSGENLRAEPPVSPSATINEKQVIDRFWDILLKSPRRGTTFERVYGYYADTGHTDQLLEKCRELADKEPRSAKSRLLVGLVQERQGRSELAVEAFEQAAGLDSNDPLAPFYLGENLVVLGRFREAVAALEESVRRKPSRIDIRAVMQSLGRVYERFGEARKSAEVWNRLENLFPDDPELLVQIAETLEAEGRLEEALERFRRLASKTRDEFARVRFTVTAADLELRLGRNREALDALDALLDRLAPESWLAESVRQRIDRIFVRDGDESGLAGFYTRRIEKHPLEAESIHRLALALRHLGRNGEARKRLEDALVRLPSNVPLRLAMIDFLVDQKEPNAAAEQYRELDRIRPNNVDFLTRWGQLVFDDPDAAENVRKDEALKIWRRIADASPDDPVAAVSLADLLLRNRMSDEAERYYRKAVELRPGESTYREYLAMFHHGRRDREKVLETLRPLAEGANRTVDTLSQLGTVLLSLGYVEESFEPFQAAAEQAPDDLPVQWRYIEALFRRGDMDAAADRIAETERLIETDEQFSNFLLQEVRFLQSSQKLGEAATRLEARLDRLPEVERNTLSTVRALWRLAVYRQAEVKTREAVEAVDRALAASGADSPSSRLLRTAAELYEQNGDGEKAVAVYEQLIRSDGVWRVEHLKRLARLQVKIGYVDRALETGRLLMGLGSGNAANLRFFADLLLSVGHRDEGIDILRQALRVEPGDISTLTLLAETLADAGKENEAIEITWRLFERTESLTEKLGLVEKLSEYYRRSGRFELLIERVQNRLDAVGENREAALCLARAFVTVSELGRARQVLEDRLDEPIREGDDDLDLLRELAAIAEMQDDPAGAVRYRERLAKRTRDPADLDRLFVLYDRVGEVEKATDLFLSRVLQQQNPEEKLAGIDRMIARQRYDAVLKIIDFLEIHETPGWQIPFRRIAVESYLGEYSVRELVEDFRALPFPAAPSSAGPGSPKPVSPKPAAFWQLPGTPPERSSFEFAEIAPGEFLASLAVQEAFLPTLFRDRLRKNERFAIPGKAEPPKPFLKVESFADARFLSLTWLLKEAVDKDLAEFQSKTGHSDRFRFKHFRAAMEEFRAGLPEDAPERELRLERLRLEIFLLDLCRLDEGRQSLAGGRLNAEVDRDAVKKTVRAVVRRFGLEGETDWQATAFKILSDEILDRRIAARFSDPEQKPAKILDSNLRSRGVPQVKDEVRTQFLDAATSRIRTALENQNEDPTWSEAPLLDRLLEIWFEYAGSEDPRRFEIFGSQIVVELPKLVWLLESSGRREKTDGVYESLEKAGRRDPLLLARSAAAVSMPFDADIALFPELSDFDPLKVRLDRMTPRIHKARDFGLADDTVDRRRLAEALVEPLATLFRQDAFDRWDFFSSQEVDLITSSIETMRDLLNPGNRTPSSHYARRLIGLEEHENADRRTLPPEQRERIRELAAGLERLADFSFDLLAETGAGENEKNGAASSPEGSPIPKPLSSYQPELTGSRTIDRSLLRSVLKNGIDAPLSTVEEFFFRLVVLCRALDTIRRNNIDEEHLAGIPADPYTEKFLEKLEKRETDDRLRILGGLRDVLTEILLPGDDVRSAGFVRLEERLKAYHDRREERNLPLDPSERLATALLKARDKRFAEVMPALDEIPLKSPQDIRSREFIAALLGTGDQAAPENRRRGEAALERLLGYRLSDQEAYKLVPILKVCGRRDDARSIVDRLVATTNDRSLQMLLLNDLGEEDATEANIMKVSYRILRNPAFFSDPRYFSIDRHIYGIALNNLKKSDKFDSVVDMLENRYKSFKDRTAGRIMLVELYLSVRRLDEARELLDELVRNPTKDSDRRAAVTTLLQRLGMRRELEEMNERLLEPTHRPDPPPAIPF